MTPAFAAQSPIAKKPAHRFLAFYVPNGMAMEYWSPKSEGAAFELSPILEPLAPFRNQMLVLSGIHANWVAIHAGASGAFLTGTPKGGRNERSSPTHLDQLLAAVRKETQSRRSSSRCSAGPCGLLHRNLAVLYAHVACASHAAAPMVEPSCIFESCSATRHTQRAAARADSQPKTSSTRATRTRQPSAEFRTIASSRAIHGHATWSGGFKRRRAGRSRVADMAQAACRRPSSKIISR